MMLTPQILETITLSHMFILAIREYAGPMERTFSHYRNDPGTSYWRRVLQKTGGVIVCVSGVDVKVQSDGPHRNIKGHT